MRERVAVVADVVGAILELDLPGPVQVAAERFVAADDRLVRPARAAGCGLPRPDARK